MGRCNSATAIEFMSSSKPRSPRSIPLSSPLIRDHLANERTYQSWMRSAIALIGFGVIIVRLQIGRPASVLPGNGWKLGLLFALAGLLTLFLSIQHYFLVRDSIEKDTYQPADPLVVLFSATVLALGVGVLYYVFAIPFEFSSQLLIE
jgi:putative membrane protein